MKTTAPKPLASPMATKFSSHLPMTLTRAYAPAFLACRLSGLFQDDLDLLPWHIAFEFGQQAPDGGRDHAVHEGVEG